MTQNQQAVVLRMPKRYRFSTANFISKTKCPSSMVQPSGDVKAHLDDLFIYISTERRVQQYTNYQWSSPLVTYRQRCLRRSTRGSDEHAIAREGHTVTHYDMLGRTRTLRRTKRHYNTLRHVRTHWDLHGHWTHYGSGTLRACKMGIRRIRRRVPRSTEHGRSRKLDLCPAPLGPGPTDKPN